MKQILFGAPAAILLVVLFVHPVFAASSEVGVVLMHGKWVSPQSMSSLARDLESKGFLVSNAEMAWSGRRLYDVDYSTALKEVEQQVQQLRGKGAKRVVLVGQSMGSNAAVAYASAGFDLDGLVILSPGHFPEGGMGKRLRSSYERARKHGRGEPRRGLRILRRPQSRQAEVAQDASRKLRFLFRPGRSRRDNEEY